MALIAQEDRKHLWRALALLAEYKKKIILILLCIMVSMGINMVMPLINKRLMDQGLIAQDVDIVWQMVLLSFFLILSDQGVSFIETRFAAYINAMLRYSLRKRAFKKALQIRMGFFDQTSVAEFMRNLDTDVNNISNIADRSTLFILSQVFKIIGGLTGLLLIDWRLTLIVLSIIPIRYKVVKYLTITRKKLYEKMIGYHGEFSGWFGDTLHGIREVRMGGTDRIKIGEFNRKQRRLIQSNIKLKLLDRSNQASEFIAYNIVRNILYIMGAYLIFDTNLTVGGLFAFITYSSYVTAPIAALMNIGYSFSSILPSAKRYFTFMDEDNEWDQGERVLRLQAKSVRGQIRFEDVSFSYTGEKDVLQNINFEIQPGERVAVIGVNGSGKTTLIRMLLRFYQPTRGRILLDGQDINEIKMRDYRQVLAIVHQDFYLFDGTARENIDPFQRLSEERMEEILVESQAKEFIDSLDKGLDQHIGKNGSSLSGGQRQKVALARALAREAKILILDEATSNFDAESEFEVHEVLKTQFKEQTVIMITHKPDLLSQLDRIILLDQGKLIAVGTHDELYRKNLLYRQMIHTNITNTDDELICSASGTDLA